MKLVFKYILRNIWAKKWRSLLIVIALIVSTAAFTLNLVLPDEILLKSEEMFRKAFGTADLIITAVDGNASLNDINFGKEKVKYSIVSQLQGTDEKGNSIVVYSADLATAKQMSLIDKTAADLATSEALLSNKAQAPYSLDEIVKFYYLENNYDIKVSDFAESIGIFSQEVNDATVFVVNPDTVNLISNGSEIRNSVLYIDVEDNRNIDTYIEYLRDNNNGYTIEKTMDTEVLKEQMSFISSIMLIVFVMTTAMVYVVIRTLNNIIIAERMPTIGTFRSIGASKRRINVILILENATYGLVGGLLGAVLGHFINGVVADLFIGNHIEARSAEMSVGTIILGAVFAITLEVLMTISSIIKANKNSIKNIIFDVRTAKYIYKPIYIIIGVVLFSMALFVNNFNVNNELVLTLVSIVLMLTGLSNLVPLFMKLFGFIFAKIFRLIGWNTASLASKNIGYNKMAISSGKLTVIALVLLIPILNISKVIANTFESFNNLYGDDVNIIVYNISRETEDYNKLLEQDSIIKIFYNYSYYDDNLTYNDGDKLNISPLFIGKIDLSDTIKELNYRIEDLEYNEILIDERLIENNNIKVDDTIRIKFGLLNKELEFKVVGTINSVGYTTARNVIVVNFDNFRDNITTRPSMLFIKVKEGVNLEKAKETIKAQLKEPFATIETPDEFLGRQRDDINGIINLIYIIVGFATILAFIAIVNNQIISFMQRKKELAILNSTCMSKGQIGKMLFFETVLTNIVSSLVAILVGSLMTGIIDRFLQGMYMYLEMFYDWKSVIIFIIIIFMVLLITLLFPIKSLKKMRIIDEIKYE